jgi:cytochrome c oxidase subunit 3
MDTMVTSTERVRQAKSGLGDRPPKNGSNGNGSRGNGDERDDGAQSFSADRHRITTWIIFAAVLMTFSAFVVSYLSLASGSGWKPIVMPRLLWLSTGLIITSSLTFNVARRSLKHSDNVKYRRWLLLTLILGLGFLASQLLSWRQLTAQGIYMASNQHSTFFYLLTGAHGIHLLGGILALGYLLFRARQKQRDRYAEMKQQASADVVSLYWHFMDGLWMFLFLLLFLWK